MNLVLEANPKFVKNATPVLANGTATLMLTPAEIGKSDYWTFRVRVSDSQSIIAFPKFTTLAIGFQKEDDWNTNLPYSCEPLEIWNHIDHNKGDDSIPDERCIEAIRMVCAACKTYNDMA